VCPYRGWGCRSRCKWHSILRQNNKIVHHAWPWNDYDNRWLLGKNLLATILWILGMFLILDMDKSILLNPMVEWCLRHMKWQLVWFCVYVSKFEKIKNKIPCKHFYLICGTRMFFNHKTWFHQLAYIEYQRGQKTIGTRNSSKFAYILIAQIYNFMIFHILWSPCGEIGWNFCFNPIWEWKLVFYIEDKLGLKLDFIAPTHFDVFI